MTKLSASKKAGLVLLLFAATAIAAPAQMFVTLVNFRGTNGYGPLSLVQGPDGSLYGTTVNGGDYSVCKPGCGTVFKMNPEARLSTLYTFCPQPNCSGGDLPQAGLVLGADGYFYGTTLGGWGHNDDTVFRITPSGTLTTLHIFAGPDGSGPEAALLQAADGNLYGTTVNGGGGSNCSYGCGTVFKITPGGTLTTLHSFDSTDGAYPYAGLIQTSDGDFYGTTSGGGAQDFGTVFRLTPEGALTTLYSFCAQTGCTDGDNPVGGLVRGMDGNLYGTTIYGGTGGCSGYETGCGTIFRITSAGTLTTLYSFGTVADDGNYPEAGLIQATDSNFYGMTSQGGVGRSGTIFKITMAGQLTTLHSFDGTDGFQPSSALLQATNGTFYGSGGTGGVYGFGTIFSLDMGLGPFVAFVRGAGKVGQTGGILGQGFTGTISVSVNGTPASFTVESDRFIRATVPAGATTGFVTVTTPSDTLTSDVPFHVLP
jgi:uncharacterized repeat protein (TIGR03803 family)